MNIQHIISIGIRFLAIGLFLYSLKLILMVFDYFDPNRLNETLHLLLVFGTPVMMLIVSLICWFIPEKLSALIIKPLWNKEINGFSPKELLRVLVIFLGFYYIINALLHMGSYLFRWAYLVSSPFNDESTYFQMNIALFVIGLQLIVGFILLTKNYWITKSILKINAPKKIDDQ